MTTVKRIWMLIMCCCFVVDLLTNCSQVVDKVLDSSDEMLNTWADLPLVTAVCEAMKQMHMRLMFTIFIMNVRYL